MNSVKQIDETMILLKRFEVSNSYCFKNKAVLDMTAKNWGIHLKVNAEDEHTTNLTEVPVAMVNTYSGENILPVAALYGKNAVGKTSLIQSLTDMIDDVLGNSYSSDVSRFGRASIYYEMSRRKYAMLSNDTHDRVVDYSICLVMGSIEYTLEYTLGQNGIEKEILTSVDYKDDSRCPKVVYDRSLGTINIEYLPNNETTKRISIHRGDAENRLWFFLIAPTVEFLRPLYEWFQEARRGITFINSIRTNRYQDLAMYLMTAKKDSHDQHEQDAWNFRSALLNSLKFIDSSIVQIGAKPYMEGAALWIYHRRPDSENDEQPIAVQVQKESSGTRAFLILFSEFFYAIKNGRPFIVDELDRSLHPTVFLEIVKLFNNPSINQNGVQLVFTAHDTIALNTNYLRQDEIHVVSKDTNSVSSITRVSEAIGINKGPNMENDYRAGVYGIDQRDDQDMFFQMLSTDKYHLKDNS